MKALTRVARRRGELHAVRNLLLAWGIPLTLIGFMTVSAYVVPRMSRHPEHDALTRTRMKIKAAAYEGFPVWLMAHPDQVCPPSLQPLMDGIGNATPLDSWGNPLDFRCGGELPDGARGIWIRSAGPDGVFDTIDDVVSSR